MNIKAHSSAAAAEEHLLVETGYLLEFTANDGRVGDPVGLLWAFWWYNWGSFGPLREKSHCISVQSCSKLSPLSNDKTSVSPFVSLSHEPVAWSV